jgi:hypothetical protein
MTEETKSHLVRLVTIGAAVSDALKPGFRERLDREEFFRFEHAISPEVWAGRPYIPYSVDDPGPVREAFRAFAPNQQTWAENQAKKCDGFIMIQHAVPGLGLHDIPPQLRPYEPILKGIKWHYHPSDDPPASFVPLKDRKPLDERYRSRAWAKALHILRDKDPDDHHGAQVAARLGYDTPEKLRELVNDPANAEDLREVLREANNEEVHSHDDYAKYLLTIAPMKADHNHADYARSRKRAEHVRKYHGGVDVHGWHVHDGNEYAETSFFDLDPRKSPGKRIDIHPLAWERFASAELVYFVMEGKVKADAVLSEILRLDLAASVCSVPSVGQWDACELPEFARRDLAGKLVVIGCDADGGHNPEVMTQALLLREFLRDPALGLRAVAIFAPPYEAYNRNKDLKGKDDHLGPGGRLLGDLEMLGRKVPARALSEWAVTHAQRIVDGRRIRKDRLRRDLTTLRGLSLLLGPGGQGQPSLKKVARFIGESDDGVERAVNSLIEFDDIRTDKPLVTARWQWRSNTYQDPNLEWEDRPTLEIIDPALRATDLPPERLSDWIGRQSAAREDDVTQQERIEIATALEQIAKAIRPKRGVSTDDKIAAATAELEAAIDAWNAEAA